VFSFVTKASPPPARSFEGASVVGKLGELVRRSRRHPGHVHGDGEALIIGVPAEISGVDEPGPRSDSPSSRKASDCCTSVAPVWGVLRAGKPVT